MSSRDGKLEVYVMNADGTEVTQLTFTTAPGVSAEAAVR
jgi:Tol biopolymer transport system component